MKNMTEETGRDPGTETRRAAAEFIRRVDEEVGKWEFPGPPAFLPDGEKHDFSFLLHDEESHGGVQENCEIMGQQILEEVYRTLTEAASSHPALEKALGLVFAAASDAAWETCRMAAASAATGMSLLDRPDPRFSNETMRMAMRTAALGTFQSAVSGMLGTFGTVMGAARETALPAAGGPDPLAEEMKRALGDGAALLKWVNGEFREAMDHEYAASLLGSAAALRKSQQENPDQDPGQNPEQDPDQNRA